MKESGIWEKFFSVKISPLKTHKIVSICGLKLKFRCDGNRKALEKLRATIRENSVLIVETNTCHYEVIPGYAKYFSELGYNVDVAVYDGGQLDFLCEAVPTVRVFTLGEKDMDKLLGAAPIRAYHYILFSSAIKYVDGVEVNSPKMPLVTSYYHNIAADQKKMIFVQHHMERQGINRNQIALADLHNRYSDNFYMVNPHYFGNVKITPTLSLSAEFLPAAKIMSCCFLPYDGWPRAEKNSRLRWSVRGIIWFLTRKLRRILTCAAAFPTRKCSRPWKKPISSCVCWIRKTRRTNVTFRPAPAAASS